MRDPDQPLLTPLPECEPVCGHGRHEAQRAARRSQQRTGKHVVEDAVVPREGLVEGEREEKGEQDLHTGLGDAQFLHQLGEVAIGVLGRCLVTLPF